MQKPNLLWHSAVMMSQIGAIFGLELGIFLLEIEKKTFCDGNLTQYWLPKWAKN